MEILTCVAVGVLGYGAQISLTHGLRSAKAAPAIATSYLSVVWGLLAGYFLFHEVQSLPDRVFHKLEFQTHPVKFTIRLSSNGFTLRGCTCQACAHLSGMYLLRPLNCADSKVVVQEHHSFLTSGLCPEHKNFRY